MWGLFYFIKIISNRPLIQIILTLISVCFIKNETQNKANCEKQNSNDINEDDWIGAYM